MPPNASIPRAVSVAVLTVLASCAHAPPVAPHVTTPEDLAPDATFGSLVSSLPTIEADRARTVGDCLVGRDASAFPRLAAELAPAVSPMPEPLDDAGVALCAADTVRLVSRYGVDGEAGPYVATFTHHRPPPSGLAVAVWIDDETLTVRSTRADGPKDDEATLARIVELVRRAADVSRPLVVLTAGPSTRLARLVEVADALAAIDAPFALGVAFVSSEPVAARPARTGADLGLCEALPEADVGAARGNLAPIVVRDSIRSLGEAFAACTASGDPRAVARGGRLRIAVRIDAQGATLARCVVEDGLADPASRACILREVEVHRWPAPDPSGIVDVVFPLVVHPSTDGDHRASCAGPDSR